MRRVATVKTLPGYRLELEFDDQVRGTVDLSGLVGKGVFAFWRDPGAFEQVRVGSSGELVWGDRIDLCADALYLKVTGKNPKDLFPALRREPTHAWDQPVLRHHHQVRPGRGQNAMSRFALALAFLLTCSAAQANPYVVIPPQRVLGTVVVIVAVLFTEACMTSMLLFFFRLDPLPMLGVLFIGNVILYVAVFLPLLLAGIGVAFSEALVILPEAALIKLASMFDVFQRDDFTDLRWRYAISAALIGNAFSYTVGRIVFP